MSIKLRLAELGIELPEGVAAAANYLPGARRGDLLFLSGQVPRLGDQVAVTGRVGSEVTMEEAQRAARICTSRLLAVAQQMLGSLDAVVQVLELTVYVHSGPEFSEPSQVADAASGMLVDVFGEAGRHARSAVCVAQLPKNAAVEIAAVFAVSA